MMKKKTGKKKEAVVATRERKNKVKKKDQRTKEIKLQEIGRLEGFLYQRKHAKKREEKEERKRKEGKNFLLFFVRKKGNQRKPSFPSYSDGNRIKVH